jgi:hypothetical protein
MEKQVLSAISGALVAGVAVVAMAAIGFFWKNPFRVGEIHIDTPNGPSLTFKVANSNEISDLIRNGLANKNSADALTNSLLSIIENLPPGSTLGEKLVELVERRRPPFSSISVPVKLVYNPNVPRGLAAVCENSSFLAKNIVVFVLGDDGELLFTFTVYADVSLAFPCPDGGETLRISATEIEEFKRNKIMAKRNF